jgi:transcriptional regulator with XRE-family HTH domain
MRTEESKLNKDPKMTSTPREGRQPRVKRVKNPLTEQLGDQQYSQIAKRAGITRSYVCRIMNRNREPSLRIAVKLAKALGISLDQLANLIYG